MVVLELKCAKQQVELYEFWMAAEHNKVERLEVQLSTARSNEASLRSVVDGTTGIVSSPPVVELLIEPPTSNGSSSGDVVQVVPGVEVSNYKSTSVVYLFILFLLV